MKLNLKIKIDKFFGKPFVSLLNLLTRFMGFLLRIDHTFRDNPKNIVVCKFLGMGSIIQATPLLQTLRKNFPQAEITFVTSESNREILSLFPFVNNILRVKENNFFTIVTSSFKLIINLWKRKTDLYIDLETYSYYSTIITTLSAARNRIGFYRKESNIRLGLYTHMEYFNSKAPISKVYLQMARVAGCKMFHEELFYLNSTNFDKNILEKIQTNNNEKIIVINPNASDIRIERRWQPEKFIKLIENILENYNNARIFLIGNNSEKEYVSAIFNKVSSIYKNRITDTSAQLNLNELISLINLSDVFISNDTGPMHIAFSLKKITIALFGPCSPQQYGIADNAICIYKNVYCSPCVHEFNNPPCNGNNECMKLIAVDEVMDVFTKIYTGVKVEINLPDIIYSTSEKPLGIVKRKKK